MNCPNGWPTWRIDECCDILDNRRIPVNSEERENRIGDIPYYGANGLQGYIDDFIFDEPLILIAEDGGRFDEFATRPIAYRISGKSWVNNHAHVLRAKKGFSQDAIFYALEHKDIQPFIVGGTRSKLNQSALRSITVSLPEQDSEQDKIAEILSTVDQAIDQTEALIAKQQRIKTGLMQDLLTRGIDENGNLRSENTWPIRKLRDIADIRVSNVDKKVHKTETTVRLCNYMDVYVNDYITNEIDFMQASASTNEIQRFSLKRGDVIITKDSETPDDIGVPAVVSDEIEHLVCGYHLCLIRPNTGDLNPIYLAKQLATSKIAQYFAIHANGSTRFGLPINAIENIALPFPPRSEQMMIAKILFTADKVIEQTGELLAEQQRIKTGLMQELLTGKVRVTPLLAEGEARS